LLANYRVRLLILLILWIATGAAIVLWIGSFQRPELTLAAGSAGSETYAFARAIAEELGETGNDMRITVFETGGSRENLALIANGQVDLAMVQGDAALPDAALGIAILYPNAYHLLVAADSGIRQFSELAGKRIAIPPRSSAQHTSFWFIAEHYGLEPADLTALPMSSSAAGFALQLGQVDAMFKVRAPGNPAISRLIKSGEMELVPVSQAEALALKQPALRAGAIPKGSYRGHPPLPPDHLSTAVQDRLLVVREDLSPNLIYRFTRALFEARSDLVHRFPLAGFMAPLEEDADSALPAHPGARRYFDREKPGLLTQNARLASALLYLVVIVGSGLIALRSRWKRSRRLRMGDFNARLMAIAESTRGNDSYESLLKAKNLLTDILHEVVSDLDAERVSQEEFEHFSFTWQAVDAMLRDQIVLLNQYGPYGQGDRSARKGEGAYG
jgi:TRAP transporter TAXI family solute receptor